MCLMLNCFFGLSLYAAAYDSITRTVSLVWYHHETGKAYKNVAD